MTKIRSSCSFAVVFCFFTLLFSVYAECAEKMAPPEVAGKYKLELSQPIVEGKTVTINGSHNFGAIVRPAWNWGDGNIDGSMFPGRHTYLKAGTYEVTLTLRGGTADGIVEKIVRTRVTIR